MKFFKKKKSDKNSIASIKEPKLFESPTSSSIRKKPPPNDSNITRASVPTQETKTRSSPVLLMPKPRRLLTPTRTILGTFNQDKTQVEDDNEPGIEGNNINKRDIVDHNEISPIFLPIAHEDSALSQLDKTTSHISHRATVSSLSTIISDDSSRVYMSAHGSVNESVDGNQSLQLRDIPYQPSTQINLQQQQTRKMLPKQYQEVSLPDKSSSSEGSSNQEEYVSIAQGQSSTSSATVTPLLHQKQQHYRAIEPSIKHQSAKTPSVVPPPSFKPLPSIQPSQTRRSSLAHNSEIQSEAQSEEQIERQRQRQKLQSEQEQFLKHLRDQVNIIEQQRIKDKEEWNRKEQEFLNHRQKMMETLIQTKDQISTALQDREETYRKQLKYQQLHQLQQKVAEMTIHLQTPLHEEENAEQPYAYDQEHHPRPRKAVSRSRSEECIRHNTRSSSSSSRGYYEEEPETIYKVSNEQFRRNSNTENGQAQKPVSRKSSTASSKSNRLNSNTESETHQYQRRPRSRSIESTRWHEEQQQPQMMATNDLYQDSRHKSRTRRSRSVGRESRRRRSSEVYHDYFLDRENDYYDPYGQYIPQYTPTPYAERYYRSRQQFDYALPDYYYHYRPSRRSSSRQQQAAAYMAMYGLNDTSRRRFPYN